MPNRPKPVRVLPRELSGQRNGGRLAAGQLLQDCLLVKPQLPRKHLRQCARVLHVPRPCGQDEARHGLRQQPAVCIHNVSAPRGHHAAARPLLHAAGGQLLLPHDLHIDKPRANAKKEEKESAHQQDQPLSYGGSR